MKLTREFGSERSRSANIVISTFTNNYLVLVVVSVFFQSYFTCVLFKRGYLSGASWLLFGTPRPPSPHDSLHDEWFHEEIYPLSSSGCRNIRGATRVCFYQCHWCQKLFWGKVSRETCGHYLHNRWKGSARNLSWLALDLPPLCSQSS
jgi:hypothetical protein